MPSEARAAGDLTTVDEGRRLPRRRDEDLRGDVRQVSNRCSGRRRKTRRGRCPRVGRDARGAWDDHGASRGRPSAPGVTARRGRSGKRRRTCRRTPCSRQCSVRPRWGPRDEGFPAGAVPACRVEAGQGHRDRLDVADVATPELAAGVDELRAKARAAPVREGGAHAHARIARRRDRRARRLVRRDVAFDIARPRARAGVHGSFILGASGLPSVPSGTAVQVGYPVRRWQRYVFGPVYE